MVLGFAAVTRSSAIVSNSGEPSAAAEILAGLVTILVFVSISSASFTNGLGYLNRDERELDRWVTSFGTGRGLATTLVVIGPVVGLMGLIPLSPATGSR